jgi:hypothetical protein
MNTKFLLLMFLAISSSFLVISLFTGKLWTAVASWDRRQNPTGYWTAFIAFSAIMMILLFIIITKLP